MYRCNKIAFKNMKSTIIKSLPLLAIIFIGFLWRLYFTRIIAVRGDEIGYLYDSYLINQGEIPFKDFHSRSPIYLYFLAFNMKFFGNSISNVRIASVIASTLNIYFIYLIGKKLYNNKIGLLCGAIFAFSPFTVKIGAMLVSESLATTLVTLSIFVIIKALFDSKPYLLAFAGFIVGISIFVRRTACLLIFLIPIFILLYVLMEKTEQKRMKDKFYTFFKKSVIFLIPALLTGFLIFLFFAYLTSFEYMRDSFFGSTAGEGHLFSTILIIKNIPWLCYRSFFSILFFILFFIGITKALIKTNMYLFKYLLPFGTFLFFQFITPFKYDEIFTLILIFVLYAAILPSSVLIKLYRKHELKEIIFTLIALGFAYIILMHLKYYSRLWNQAAALILLLVVVEIIHEALQKGATGLRKKEIHENSMKKRTYLVNIKKGFEIIEKERFAVVIIVIISFFLFIEESIYDGQEKVILNLCYIFSLILLLYLVRFIHFPKIGWAEMIIVVWFFGFFVFYYTYGQFLEYYFYEFMASISLAGGIGVGYLIKGVPKNYRIVLRSFLIIAIVSILVSNSIVLNINEQQTNKSFPSPETIEKTAKFLKERTEPTEEIFTASFAIVVATGLRVPFDISHAYYYNHPEIYISREMLNYPTLDELKKYLIEKHVRYSVIDPATRLCYFLKNPDFEKFIMEHYTFVKSINQVEIYHLNEEYMS